MSVSGPSFFYRVWLITRHKGKVLDLRDTVLPFLLLNAKEQSSELDQDTGELFSRFIAQSSHKNRPGLSRTFIRNILRAVCFALATVC